MRAFSYRPPRFSSAFFRSAHHKIRSMRLCSPELEMSLYVMPPLYVRQQPNVSAHVEPEQPMREKAPSNDGDMPPVGGVTYG